MTARSRLTGEPCARSVPRGPVRSRRVITDVADDLRPGRLEHLAIALPDGGQHGFTVQSSRSPLQHRAEKRIITSAYTSVAKSVASTVDEKLSPAPERLQIFQQIFLYILTQYRTMGCRPEDFFRCFGKPPASARR